MTATPVPFLKTSRKFDFHAHREFTSDLEVLLRAPSQVIDIDLGGTIYLDSSALGMLLIAKDKATSVNKTIRLINATGAVEQVLGIAKFEKLFQII